MMRAGTFMTTFAARVATAGLGIAAGILIARALGPQGKGSLAAAQLLVGIVVTLASGIGVGLTHFLTKRAIRAAELLVPLGLLLAAICGAAELAGAVDLGMNGWSPIVLAAMAAAPASLVLAMQMPYYSALGMLGTMNVQIVALAAAVLFGTGTALLLHGGTGGILIAWALSTTIVAAVVMVNAVGAAGRIRIVSAKKRASELLLFGVQASGNSFLGWLTYRVDSVFIGAMLGIAAFGIYSVAVSLSEVFLLISRSVTTVLTREIGSRDSHGSARITAQAVRTVTFLIAFSALAAWFVIPFMVRLLYGDRFDGSILAFRLLLPGIVAFANVGTFCAFFLFQLGRPLIVTWLNVWTIALEAVLCAALIPRMGLAGAALASSITYAIGAIYCTVRFCAISGLPAAEVWIVRLSDLRMLTSALRKRQGKSTANESIRPVLLVTGAAGSVGTLIRPHLREHFDLILVDKIPVGGLAPQERFMRCDVANERKLLAAARGVDAVVHLASMNLEDSFRRQLRGTIATTQSVLEAARKAKVGRLVLASTGHVTGYYLKNQRVSERDRVRPDSPYGAAKVFCEALASLYADNFGMRVLTIRIGHCSQAPSGTLDRAIWISPRDLAQLIRIGVENPRVANDVVYGTSSNSASWWDPSAATALGYLPLDSADDSPVDERDRTQPGSIFQCDYRVKKDRSA
jgi:uronate dehydrogenase